MKFVVDPITVEHSFLSTARNRGQVACHRVGQADSNAAVLRHDAAGRGNTVEEAVVEEMVKFIESHDPLTGEALVVTIDGC